MAGSGDRGPAAGDWYWFIDPESRQPAYEEAGVPAEVRAYPGGGIGLRIGHPARYPHLLVLAPAEALKLADRLRAAASRRVAG